jgi:hypothetical protein
MILGIAESQPRDLQSIADVLLHHARLEAGEIKAAEAERHADTRALADGAASVQRALRDEGSP